MLENIDLGLCQHTDLWDFSLSVLCCLEAGAEQVSSWTDRGWGSAQQVWQRVLLII